MELNPRYLAFCEEYIKDHNGAQAAIRAGYSRRTANVQASKLLTIPSIAEKIAVMQALTAQRNAVDADWVLKRLRQVHRLAIEGNPIFEKGQEVGRKIDFGGANRALELIGKHIGMFVERRELSGPGGKPLEVSAALAWDLSKLDDFELDLLKSLVKRVSIASATS
jgi:phage terminase small subunit